MGLTSTAPAQLLPTWGADPRHKDIFIEVDFMMREQDPEDDPPPDQRIMSPDNVRALAQIYRGETRDADALVTLWRATSVQNPDGRPGIELHLDTGVDPAPGSGDERLYGDWGGHEDVEAIYDPEKSMWRGEKAKDVWRERMHPNRHGMFHYALVYNTGGGQGEHNVPYSSWNQTDVGNTAHEFAHTLNVGHGGLPGAEPYANCKPNYPSLANYGFLNTGGERFFSDGLGRPHLKNTELDEVGAVADPTSLLGNQYLDDLEHRYHYLIDRNTGDVDWNRDGVFSPTPVRAYANDNTAGGAGCEMTRHHNMYLLDSYSDRDPAIVKMAGATYVFYLDAWRNIRFRVTPSSLHCPGSSGRNCGDAQWLTSVNAVHRAPGIRAFDVHPLSDHGSPKLLVVFYSVGGLYETLLNTTGQYSDQLPIPAGAMPTDGISLAGTGSASTLAYKSESGQLRTIERNNLTGTWHSDQVAVAEGEGGLYEIGIAPSSAPALLAVPRARSDLPAPIFAYTLYGAFPGGSDGAISVYTRDESRVWHNTRYTKTSSSRRRPALAWEPLPAESTMPGRLHVFYISRDNGVVRQARTLMTDLGFNSIPISGGGGPTSRRVDLSLDGPHDNVWYHGHGIDVWRDGGWNNNIKAVVVGRSDIWIDDDDAYFHTDKECRELGLEPGCWVPKDGLLEVRPNADGIIERVQRNWNNWDIMRVGICKSLAPFGPDAVNCPPDL
jgi:hypothetical protein